MQVKRCSECRKLKDVLLFYKKRHGLYGVEGRCKNCTSRYHKIYVREKRVERRLKKQRYLETPHGCSLRLLNSCRLSSKKNSYAFDLDYEWVMKRILTGKCSITGIDFDYSNASYSVTAPFKPSIDRIDNTKGYTKDNCQVVCYIYNRAKGDYRTEDLERMIQSYIKNKEKLPSE